MLHQCGCRWAWALGSHYAVCQEPRGSSSVASPLPGSGWQVSAAKSIEVIYPKTPNGTAASSGLVATPPTQAGTWLEAALGQENKGQKRSREEKPPEPRAFEPQAAI